METIFITNCQKIAILAEKSGVDRIMVDLEIIGKEARQGHLNTVISHHTLDDVRAIRQVISKSKLLVRINPIHEKSKEEIEDIIELGVEIIMLPMFTTKEEVLFFVHQVGNRCKKMLLLETPQALTRIDDILSVEGIDEIHVGLNDLHLAMNLDFMFELLSGGIIEYLASKIIAKGKIFGFGGIARIGEGMLDSTIILSEHKRLGSQIVILSRDFHGYSTNYEELINKVDLKMELEKLRSFFNNQDYFNPSTLAINHNKLKESVNQIVNLKRNNTI